MNMNSPFIQPASLAHTGGGSTRTLFPALPALLSAFALAASAQTEPDVLSQARLRFDASDLSTLTFRVTARGDGTAVTNGVTAWKNKGLNADSDAWVVEWSHLPRYKNGAVDFGEIGSSMDMGFTGLQDAKTVFWVIDIEQSANAFLLGCTWATDFHRGQNGAYCSSEWAADGFHYGAFWDNGEPVADPVNTPIPTGMRVISFVLQEKAKGLSCNRITRDRNYTQAGNRNRSGGKKLSELIIFNTRLGDEDRQAVETYLAEKWAGRLAAEPPSPFSAAWAGSAAWTGLAWTDDGGAPVQTGGWDYADVVRVTASQAGAVLTVDRDVSANRVELLGEPGATLKFAKGRSIRAAMTNGTSSAAAVDLSEWSFTAAELGEGPIVRKTVVGGAAFGLQLAGGAGAVPQPPEGWLLRKDTADGIALVYVRRDPEAPAVIDGAALHYDASDGRSVGRYLTVKGDGSVTTNDAVFAWADAGVSVNNARTLDASDALSCNSPHPPRYADGAVDFGACGSLVDMAFRRLTDIRTAFWVVRMEPRLEAFLLGDTQSYDFQRGQNGEYASWEWGKTRYGSFWNNGAFVADPVNTPLPIGFQLITFQAGGGDQLAASRLTTDRTQDGRNGGKTLAELILFNTFLGDADRQAVEAYLRSKWAGKLKKMVWNGGDGRWGDDAKWTPPPWEDGYPTVFPEGGAGTVAVDRAAAPLSLRFEDSYVLAAGSGGALDVREGTVWVAAGKTAEIAAPFLFGGSTNGVVEKIGGGALILSAADAVIGGLSLPDGRAALGEGVRLSGGLPVTLGGDAALALAGTKTAAGLVFDKDASSNRLEQAAGGAKGRLNISGGGILHDNLKTGGAWKQDVEISRSLAVDGVELSFGEGKTFTLARGPWGTKAFAAVTGGGLLKADRIEMANAVWGSEAWAPKTEGVLTLSSGGTLACRTLVMNLSNYNSQYTVAKARLEIAGGTARLGAVEKGMTHTKPVDSTRVIAMSGGTIRNYDADTDLSIPDALTSFTLAENTLNVFYADPGRSISAASAISGPGTLVKRGGGALTLSATNTYTGGTVVEEGELVLAADNAIALDGAVTLSGGTLRSEGRTNDVGRLVLGGHAVLAPAGGSLSFEDSSREAWADGAALTVACPLEETSIRFGTSSSALTDEQQKKISCGDKKVMLDMNGYLIYVRGTVLLLR